MTFLIGQTANFFRPLTGKWRFVIGRCIQAMHARLYGSHDGAQPPLSKDALRELFVTAIREAPLGAQEADNAAVDDLQEFDARDEHAFASSIVRYLIKTGWLEVDDDKTQMLQFHRFSKAGRLFADSLAEIEQPPLRTRQRNVRKTVHFLDAYLRDLEPYDLIDALNHADHVVRDFADDIAELNERRQRLIQEAMARPALEDFLDYIQTRFVPDLSIRISADSVERYRSKIGALVSQIRALPIARLRTAQEQLRRALNGHSHMLRHDTVLFDALNRIETTVRNACEAKMPEIRAALQAYVVRSSIMIRQASGLLGGHGLHQLREYLENLARLDVDAKEVCLAEAGARMTLSEVRLLDPHTFQLPDERETCARALVVEDAPPTREERLQAAIRQAQSYAFSVNLGSLRRSLMPLIDEAGVLRLSHLNINNAADLLAAVFALNALASVAQGRACVAVKELPARVTIHGIDIDDFEFTKRRIE